MGVLMWPVMTFFTNSTIHMVAHGAWAQVMMLAGAAELGLVKGKLRNELWRFAMPLAFLVSGLAFLLHEQNPWLFQRSSFLHHLLGWTMLFGAVFPLTRALRPRWAFANAGIALVFVVVSGTTRAGADPRMIVTTLKTLPKGAYTVRWHALSSDGHTVSGVWTFGLGVAAPPPTEAYGASGPTRTEHVVRWAYFLALALLVGGLGFRLLIVRGPLPPRAESRFYKLTGLGVVAVLEVGIVAFLLRAEDALQLPFTRLLYGDLSPVASGTRFGTAFIAMTLGFALVAALLFLSWLLEQRALLWIAFAVALGFASGLSLSGHSAADAGASWKSELADWVHLSAACLWLGGLVQLALVVWPLAPELRREAFLRYARLHQPTEPEAGGREMHPVRELRLPRRAGVRGRVPRQGEAGREAERDRERNPEQRTLLEQPRQEEQSGDEREAERHRDESRAEARTARDRREVAVQQPRER